MVWYLSAANAGRATADPGEHSAAATTAAAAGPAGSAAGKLCITGTPATEYSSH